MQIKIDVKNKTAVAAEDYKIICGNSDYVVLFSFDDEWQEHTTKTARFSYTKDGARKYIDVLFEGNECIVPVLSNTLTVEIGVYAGDLRTTTPCLLMCEKSILCENGLPDTPPENFYNQILEKCEEAVEAANAVVGEMVGVKDSRGNEIFNDYENNKIADDEKIIKNHVEGFNNEITNAHPEYKEIAGNHVEGKGNKAGGTYGHVENSSNQTYETNAHAGGKNCVASASGAFAQGRGVIAFGVSAHAEGQSHKSGTGQETFVLGIDGKNTGITWEAEEGETEGERAARIASKLDNLWHGTDKDDTEQTAKKQFVCAIGMGAHAEGVNTFAKNGAHAEGTNTEAGGAFSHSEGEGSTATGQASHAEGRSKASGAYSHSEGLNDAEGKGATGNCSHVEGENNLASGTGAHAEGKGTEATIDAAHAEGSGTRAAGYGAHAEGQDTKALSGCTHSEGQATQASGWAAHAEGGVTQASGAFSHSEGQETKATGQASHAEGYKTQAKGQASHAAGEGTIAAGNNQTVVGKYNAVNEKALFIVGNGSGDNARSNVLEVYSDQVIINTANTGELDVGQALILLASNLTNVYNLITALEERIEALEKAK